MSIPGLLGSLPPDVAAGLEAFLPFDKTLGAYLLGTFAGLMLVISLVCDDTCSRRDPRLYGLSVHQMYVYYRSFPSDDLYIRLLVGRTCPYVSSTL